MVDIDLTRQMLAKVNPEPFYFGGDNHSYFWRVVEVDGIIYAELAQCVDEECYESYYCCMACDKISRQLIYEDIIIDFCVYYADGLRSGKERDVFGETTGGPGDKGLSFILSVFGKEYGDFLRDVFYWFSVVIETEPNEDGCLEVRSSSLSDNARIAKKVIDRSESNPIVITDNNSSTDYYWWIIKDRDFIWYLRSVRRMHGEYIFISDEYGCVSQNNVDAVCALRDAVRCPFLSDGAEVIETGVNVDEVLALIGLSLEEI